MKSPSNVVIKDFDKEFLVSSFLRYGLAIVFLYAAFSAFLNPSNWIGFIPDYLTFGLSKSLLLTLFSTYELILGLLLLSNYKIFKTSIFSTITLFLIIGLNIQVLDIVFRDLAIIFMSLTLNVISYGK